MTITVVETGTTYETIQSALDAADSAGGATVYITGGDYAITTALEIGSNTTLILEESARIYRDAAINNVLRNKSDGTTGGYDAAENITIIGGTFDGVGSSISTNCTVIAFGHAKNINLRNVSVVDAYRWHCVEVNGCKNVTIRDCEIATVTNPISADGELVQIDLMKGSGQFPWFGPYDDTACDNVKIQNCLMYGSEVGVGTHSESAGSTHERIKITGCEFHDLGYAAIRPLDWSNLIVQGCDIYDCERGVYVVTEKTNNVSGIVVTGNTFTNIGAGGVDGRCVYASGGTADSAGNRDYVSRISVTNNIIDGCTRHAVGIDYCDTATVSGNQFNDVDRACIFVWFTPSYVVSGNTCTNSSSGASESNIDIGSGSVSGTVICIVESNVVDSIEVDNTSTCIISNNIIKTEIGVGSGTADVQIFNNYIAGTWTASGDGS